MKRKLFLLSLLIVVLSCSERVRIDDLRYHLRKGGKLHISRWYNDPKTGRLVQKVDEEPFTGVVYSLYPDSSLKLETGFKEGILHGRWREWHRNGQLAHNLYHVNGRIDGEWIQYFENGNISSKAYYDMGKEIKLTYYYKNGQKEYYRTDLEEGGCSSKEWYENGQLKEIGVVDTNSHQIGNKIVWYENGQIERKNFYLEGRKEGGDTTWYADGKLKRVCNYKNGKENGDEIYWHANGNIKSKMSYIEGRLNGMCKEWFENGNIKSEGEYKNGEKVNIWISYNEDGIVLEEKRYDIQL